MRFKCIGIFGVFFLFFIVKFFYFPISPNGSVNTKLIRSSIKGCLFIYSDCKSNIFLRDVTDFKWDTAYLIPYNFYPRGAINVNEDNYYELSTLDFLQLSFFLKGKEVHYELFSYGSPNWISIPDPDAVPIANQIVFFDSPVDNPFDEFGEVNLPNSNKYFKCSHKSSLKVKKFISARGQWPGKIILVEPENCEIKYADTTIKNK